MVILIGLVVLAIVLMVLKAQASKKPKPVVRPVAGVQRSPDSPVVVPLSDARVQLRMPEHLRDRLLEAATRNNRPMTAEILARLEASIEAERRNSSS